MAPIARPRLRPRKRSVNFRPLWWVVTREAALHVLFPEWWADEPESAPRRWLARTDTYTIRRGASALLRRHLGPQFWPPADAMPRARAAALLAAPAEYRQRLVADLGRALGYAVQSDADNPATTEPPTT